MKLIYNKNLTWDEFKATIAPFKESDGFARYLLFRKCKITECPNNIKDEIEKLVDKSRFSSCDFYQKGYNQENKYDM